MHPYSGLPRPHTTVPRPCKAAARPSRSRHPPRLALSPASALPLTSGRPFSPRRRGGRVRPCTAAAGTPPPYPPTSADGSARLLIGSALMSLRFGPTQPLGHAGNPSPPRGTLPLPQQALGGGAELQFPQCSARSPGAERPGPEQNGPAR